MHHDPRSAAETAVSDFRHDDLFMSRTNKAGIIQAGNATFARLSGYRLMDMIGKPHKLVRHPDMPTGVFEMMWSWLKQDRPFIGFVKNRASDGRFYWVLAAVMPVSDGYVSVRMKPSAERVAEIAEAYADLRRIERAERLEPDAARQLLRDKITELGFPNYRRFACDALLKEVQLARVQSGDAPLPYHENYERVASLVLDLNVDVRAVVASFDRIQGSPANLAIQASRLDEGSAAVKVIAQNYRLLSDHLRTSINSVLKSLEELTIIAEEGRMYAGTLQLYRKATEQFEQEEWPTDAPPKDSEITILNDCIAGMEKKLVECFRSIGAESRTFVDSINSLRMQASGLAVTRVMCNIEAATVRGDTSGLFEITRRLDEFQDDLGKSLDKISAINSTISAELGVIMNAKAA